MKRFSFILLLIIIINLFYFNTAYANPNNGLRSGIEMVKDKKQNSGILYLDKTESEDIVIALKDYRIYVYSKNGIFKYGLVFHTEGGYSFKINKKNQIEIFLFRGSHLFTYSLEGKFIKYDSIPPDSEEESYYLNLNSKDKVLVGGNQFFKEGIFFSSGFAPTGSTQLVYKEKNKKGKIIYDSSSESRKNAIKTLVFIFIWITGAILAIVLSVKKYKKKKLDEIKS